MKHAKEEAVRLGHSYVGSEHLLLGLIRLEAGLGVKILDIYDIDLADLRAMIEDMIKSSGGTMTLGHLPLTRRAERILRNAYNEAAALGASVADDEHLLLAMLKETEGIAFEVLNSYNLDYDGVLELLHDDASDDNDEDDDESLPIIKKEKSTKKSKTPALDHFSRDITSLARKGELDPVIGRMGEIERVAQILTRRKKNNPVLIGEPGVGKTAIIEGLAIRINEKSVPRLLHNKRILSLDLASIVAGTKYRGQFEERMKTIMVELENTDNLILFIDELHTLVGAGGASGSLDASNMFKPALARGDIHCIGATTLDEFRKHIEKDGALERRFQKIMVNPPSQDETIEILNGLKEAYEGHHNVRYDKSAIDACVYLSDRYITDKYLPDKAIDIMDEAGSRAHLHNVSVPQEILEMEKEIDEVRTRKEEVVAAQKFEKAAKYRDTEQKLITKLSKAQQEWQEHEHSKPELISEDTIADVVALVSGIPVNKVAESETNKLLKMEDTLKKNIIGQEQAINSIAKSIQRARAGLKNPNRPIGVFLFLGPTGVGKTELAKVLANYLFSNTGSLIKIDMSEFGERFSVSRLIGAPPGYVGYEEGGELTEKVRRNPYSVILFDEMEKAHPDVFNLLLQLYDEGVLTDSLSRKVDFKNTIIIMTSNLGTKEILKGSSLGFVKQSTEKSYETMRDKLLEKVKTTFSPEFLNRLDETIVFHTLAEEHVLNIIDLQLEDLRSNLKRKGMKVKLMKSAVKLLLKKGYNPEYGARHLRRQIQNSLEDPIAEMLLEDKFVKGDTIKVNAKKGDFFYIKAPVKKTKSKKSTSSVDSTEEI
ncbi:MAG TPA: ATP-dependent Clp protease ATP-binding subunit [Candidatus Marinimicrobia bacterium]|nr:ATP-dependent Clp protease ATP-binding subunit [Candidatus Neomarinimicrobiota bacterium]MDP6229896.1 ATP-dependent Clp protease ATP-binding subunit [Candidatus Neomarinimicrobiota bacterium]MDP7095048.1 ATP-dependent Clp protease ATP-binding subunit [Candidatus Neomarinimicrobiota bacterium]MDP7512931.1 ATP-dependent Clp protease ATP-binding subunit [Candidatus Neomarinimicrobiota bacterium]HJL63093.1 ATP-dependent Clp protease ATP-binding subunit [Candidatus Neomarinimicrobiota bacterium]